MKISEYTTYDGLGLAELVKNKEVTPEELVNISVSIIKELNPTLNAVASIIEEKALEEIKNGLPQGPFEGVPFLIKELVLHAKGIPVNMGSRLAKGITFPVDSELMARFRKAGVVTVGTTTTPEFGYNAVSEATLYGNPTVNPWDTNHSPGGSSGGSAAAIAAGITPLAHANDGGAINSKH